MRIDEQTPTAPGQPDPVTRQRATQAAVQFEAFFIKQMMKQMHAGTKALAAEDSPMHKRVNEDMRDFADGQVADSLAGQRAFGIADLLLRQLFPAAPFSAGPAASPFPKMNPEEPRS